jgi:hypothetical protein
VDVCPVGPILLLDLQPAASRPALRNHAPSPLRRNARDAARRLRLLRLGQAGRDGRDDGARRGGLPHRGSRPGDDGIRNGGVGAPWGYPPWQQVPYPDPSWQVVAEQRMFDRCMRGRGYELMRTDKKG